MAVSSAPATASPPLRDVDARRLILAAADAAPLAFICAMWINQVASGAAIAVRWAFGEDSSEHALAKHVAYGAFLFMVPLLPLAHQRMVIKLNAQRRRPEPALIGIGWDGRVTSVPVLSIFLCCVLIMLSLLIQWLAPAKFSGVQMIGAGLCDLGSFLSSVTMCSIILPNFIILLRAPAT